MTPSQPLPPPGPDAVLAAIERLLKETDFGTELAREGMTTVALDDDGQIVEYRPT